MGPEADTGCEEGEGLSGSQTDRGSLKRHECRAHPGGECSLLRGSSMEGREGVRNWWMRPSERDRRYGRTRRMRFWKPEENVVKNLSKYFIKIKATLKHLTFLVGEGLNRRWGLSCVH